MIRILAVGKDHFTYNRTAVLIAGLDAHSEVSITCQTLVDKSYQSGQLLRQQSAEFDYIFVPAFRHNDVRFIKKWSQVPIIFDPLISKFSTKVMDYKQYWKAYKYIIDYRAFHRADLLIADTDAHRNFYRKAYRIPFTKSVTIPVGVNTSLYHPRESTSIKKKKTFVVGFYGSFVPLQGTSVILEAAYLLLPNKDITFRLIGTGYQYKATQAYIQKNDLTNVELLGWIDDQSELKETILDFDVCLGIFGSSKKTNSVVPNKVYHYAALGKPIITTDTKGIREVLDDSSACLIKADAKILAETILKLKDDDGKRRSLSNNALSTITNGYTHHHVAQMLVDRLKSQST